MEKKNRTLLRLLFLFIWLTISFFFYDQVAFWPAVTSLGLTIISLTSGLLHEYVEKENSVMLSFFFGMISRLFFFLILALFFISLRNATDVWFIVAIFIVYLSDLLFELKYIIHNLRAN